MGIYDWLKKRDSNIADCTAGGSSYFSLSPTRWSLYKHVLPRMPQALRGRCLDAGAGRMAFSDTTAETIDEYVAMDINPRPGISICGSVLSIPLQDATVDSVLCLQVLEHVPDPQQAMREFFRCLKPDGTVLISVPHLAYLHNEPHDYFRFTHHGLRFMLERAGFEVIEIVPAGGLLSFVGHIPSMIIKAVFFSIPGLNRIALSLNSVYSKTISWIDQRIEKRKLFALFYVVIARKSETPPAAKS